MTFFQPQPNHQQCKHLMSVLLLLLLAAILLWVLNTMNIVQGAWATVLNAVFTGLSTIFALLQWHAQANSEHPGTASSSIPVNAVPNVQLVQSSTNKRKGAIVVYASRKWRGSVLHLVQGLQETTGPLVAVASVVECLVVGQRQFLCRFPAVSPGHYTIVAPSMQRRVQITVYPGHFSEIDWRWENTEDPFAHKYFCKQETGESIDSRLFFCQ